MGNKENYEYCKTVGRCVTCQSQKAMDGAVRCLECAEKLAIKDGERYLKLKESNKYEAWRKEVSRKRKERRDKRRAEGVCWVCGKRPVQPGYMKCIDCLIKQRRKKDYRYNNDIPRDVRVEIGLCYICGQPAVEGRKVCLKHYENIVECAKRGREARNSENHIWHKANAIIFKHKKISPQENLNK